MGQYKRMFLALLTIIGLAACQSGPPPFECTDAIDCVTIGPGEPIKVGAIQTLSGEVSPLGIDQVRAIELIMADRDNQLLGHPLQLQSEDSLCSGEGGTTAALKIVADPQIIGIIGTTCSGEAVTAAKVMSEAGLVMISGSNTSPSLTSITGEPGPNWQPGYFRTAHNDAVQGRVAATFAFEELGIRKAATINDGDAYTQGLTRVFNQAFTELGGEIVLATSVNKGDADMRPVLSSVADSGAELLYFPIFEPEGNFIALQTKEVEGLENIVLMGADALLTDTFLEVVGSAGIGMFFSGPASAIGSDYDAFVTQYKSNYGEAPLTPWHAFAADAVNILFQAIESSAVQDPKADGTLHIGRQALREAISATSGFQGLTGTLACDEYGDCSASKMQIVRLNDPAAGIEGLANNVVYTYTPGQ